MFVRTIKQRRGEKVYKHLQIVESFRDPAKGNAPRTRLIAHLGTVDGLGEEQIDRLILGLRKAKGEDVADVGAPPALAAALDFGHVHAVGGVWDGLGLSDALAIAGVDGETTFSPSELIRLLVVNRICEPLSKWALMEWLDSVRHGGAKPSYHHLLRAMDRLIDAKEKVEPLVARKLLPPGEPVDLVFYDITSTYFEGDRSLCDDDFRKFGYSRDGRFDKRQVVIGMVMTRSGIPLCHHVFPGNTADKTTVAEVVADLKARFDLTRVVFVGDRGMLSDANLLALLDDDLGFIVAHPLRRNEHAKKVVGSLFLKFDRDSDEEQFLEEEREGLRFVVAYSPKIAKANKAGREERLRKADAWIDERLGKLVAPSGKGRKPTPQGTYDKIRDHLRDHGLLGLYDVAVVDGEVIVAKNRAALLWESRIDGMLMVETTDAEMTPKEIVGRYKELAEIERGWRSLKSTLLLRPVHHWTEERIRAHVFVCVLALQVERWMRNRLMGVRLSDDRGERENLSVPRAIERLKRIKAGEIEFGGRKFVVPTRVTPDQASILAALGVPPIASIL